MPTLSGSPKPRQDLSDSDDAIFGAHAVALRQAGLAVIPAKGKSPIRKGFNNWKRAPGLKAVEQWAETNPADNIVYIPGLSRSKRNPDGLVIVDADDRQTADRVGELFGETPAQIDTRKGRHFLYKAPAGSLGTVHSLRKFGLNVDIKHGQAGSGISVAPPSRHPDQRDFSYGWAKGSSIEALNELPAFNVRALQQIIDTGSKTLPNVTETAPAAGKIGTARTLGKAFPKLFRDGSRKLGLNDHLCSHAAFIDDLDTALDISHSWNDDLQGRWGIEPLPVEEVIEVCTAVMKDVASGKIVRTHKQRGTAITDADEVRQMMAMFDNGESAFALLMLLRAEHTARCLRGETFAICIKSMVEAETMGRWAARKYRDARDTLLAAGFIERVAEARWKFAAQYRLTDRVLTPSIAARGAAAGQSQ